MTDKMTLEKAKEIVTDYERDYLDVTFKGPGFLYNRAVGFLEAQAQSEAALKEKDALISEITTASSEISGRNVSLEVKKGELEREVARLKFSRTNSPYHRLHDHDKIERLENELTAEREKHAATERLYRLALEAHHAERERSGKLIEALKKHSGNCRKGAGCGVWELINEAEAHRQPESEREK